MKIGANLETIYLGIDDVRKLGSELRNIAPNPIDFHVAIEMEMNGVISSPLKIWGMNIASKKKAFEHA